MRTYINVKEKLKMEKYIEIPDERGRRSMARLRSGTNDLRIETGRYVKLERDDRRCWFGCEAVEDEEHFLLDCKMYAEMRSETIQALGLLAYRKVWTKMVFYKDRSLELSPNIISIIHDYIGEEDKDVFLEKYQRLVFGKKGLMLMMGKGNREETAIAVSYIKRAEAKRKRMLELLENE